MSYVEMFNRDKKRFSNNLDSLNETLGVALAGTSFNMIEFITKKLGFKIPKIIQIQFQIEICFRFFICFICVCYAYF